MIERDFDADHPAARGHFPGNPIIPGALLLAETLEAIARDAGGGSGPFQVRSAKFLSPARPGERLVIRYARGAQGDIRFSCAVGERPVLSGQATCGGPPAAK